jgi:hypothetical protein
MFCF